MTKLQKDFYNKTLVMLALAGAILGVAHAGYDNGLVSGQDTVTITAQASTGHN